MKKVADAKQRHRDLITLHNNSIFRLRQVIKEKNDILKRFAEFYPDINSGPTVQEGVKFQ
ncbi:hypothetical protein MHBO_000447 [Bonamia ostreae]|uniref:Uncharacterized protein n=1 Tax=Bonamia ostreae TaxID=126728 RepID=A0ABV2AFQ7_9EUKA